MKLLYELLHDYAMFNHVTIEYYGSRGIHRTGLNFCSLDALGNG